MIAKTTAHRLIFLTAIGLSVGIIVSCTPREKEYSVTIISKHPVSKFDSEKKKVFKAPNDTSAFKEACQTYWIHKIVALENNKRYEGYDVVDPSPVPFYFMVDSKDGRVVTYDKEEAERLTEETVKYFKVKIAAIDTIVPFIKQPKEKPAEIY